MLKRIPKSDISIRPFKAYKEWTRDTSNASMFIAEPGNYASTNETTATYGYLSGSSYNKHSIFGQLRAQFYNGNEDNPFIRFGAKKPLYIRQALATERFLSGSAKIISIPQTAVGESIKKGSVIVFDDSVDYLDDTYGNLYDNRDKIYVSLIDIQQNILNFTDLAEYVYSGSFQTAVGDFDLQTGTFNVVYNGVEYDMILEEFDINSGIMIVTNIPFLPEESQGIKVGNIFYSQGLIVITRDAFDRLGNDWDMVYKSTETIYEHEYLLIANEDEFNVSQNPSAIVEVGKESSTFIDTNGRIHKVTSNPGVKYIKKKSVLETGEIVDYRFASNYTSSVSGGFEHYDLSGSVDSTGSFLSPFITTIGLYDDNCELVAVAKLPQPIKSEPDIPVNFIVRFDT